MKTSLRLDGPVPTCSECGALPIGLQCREIPDGITTILTEWEWVDAQSHTWPFVGVNELCVPTDYEIDKLELDESNRPVVRTGGTVVSFRPRRGDQ